MKSYLEIITERKQFKEPTEKEYLELAKILEKEQGKPFTLEQAKEVGDGLISLLTTLANGRKIVKSKSIGGKQDSNFSNRGKVDKK